MKVLLSTPEEAPVLGHHTSIVLNQIRYWLYKAKKGQNWYVVERFGETWLAHSRAQLCEETRMSPRQMRDAVAKLKKHGFIRVEQHLFQGKNVSHFQAEMKGNLEEKGQTETAPDVSPDVDEYDHPGLDQSDQLIKEENFLEIKEEYGAPSALPFLGKKEKGKKEKKPRDTPSAVKPAELCAMFRAGWNEEYAEFVLPEFDPKAMGQFKNLLQVCPTGEAAEIVDYSVRHWDIFCSRAISGQGAFKLPNLPDLGTLLRFVQSAVQVYHDHRNWRAKAATQKKKRFIPPQPVPPIEHPKEKPATLEELRAIWPISL